MRVVLRVQTYRHDKPFIDWAKPFFYKNSTDEIVSVCLSYKLKVTTSMPGGFIVHSWLTGEYVRSCSTD